MKAENADSNTILVHPKDPPSWKVPKVDLVDSSTSKQMEMDEMMARMLQEIEDRRGGVGPWMELKPFERGSHDL